MARDMSALEDFVLERMGKTKLSGVSMAVVKDGEVIYQRGFGLANRERGIPATPETNYCIGSVTKSFTCLGIMQLQERGLLSIDDPVEKFLPLLDCRGGKSSIDRDVMTAGERAHDLHRQAPRLRVRVLGVDGTGAAMAGQDRGDGRAHV